MLLPPVPLPPSPHQAGLTFGGLIPTGDTTATTAESVTHLAALTGSSWD